MEVNGAWKFLILVYSVQKMEETSWLHPEISGSRGLLASLDLFFSTVLDRVTGQPVPLVILPNTLGITGYNAGL